MLLICPVRPGDANEELRYALRSWETNLILPGRLILMVVGYRPSWLKPDEYVEANRYASMPKAVFDNVRMGAEKAVKFGWDSVNSECLFMNDDFFCMDPVGAVLPVRRNCTLEHHMSQFPVNASTWWPRSLRLTASWLAEAGFPCPWSYEVHRPLLASPAAMYETLSKWDIASDDTVPQWRTMYGAHHLPNAYPVIDAKLGNRSPGFGTPWVSTSDASWRRYGPDIKKRFQKPSCWEIG